MKPTGKILLVEDDPSLAASLQHVLQEEGHAVVIEARGDSGLERACREPFDIVLTDLRLPGADGLHLVRQLHLARPRVPIILVTAHGTTQTAITATQFGAYDYLLKPFEMRELLELVQRALRASRLMSEPVTLGDTDPSRDAIVGNSRVMQDIYKEIGRVSARPVDILIRGETGTGKELIARAIYQHSGRADKPFVAINCAAIPETLLESELFGHERGAFTGAESRRIGRFEQADRGTIFLDEIGDMPLGTQAKLLRVLQEKNLQRLGGREALVVDVRVIAATNQELEAAIQEKRFREDLFYRLNVVAIRLPPLRDRREDIPALLAYFLRKHGRDLGSPEPSIHPGAVQMLTAQPWPGNVRELENVVRKALLLAGGYTISAEHVSLVLTHGTTPDQLASHPLRRHIDNLLAAAESGDVEDVHRRLVESVERELFNRALELSKGNQAQAARWLGISRLTLREKLIRYGLHPGREDARD